MNADNKDLITHIIDAALRRDGTRVAELIYQAADPWALAATLAYLAADQIEAMANDMDTPPIPTWVDIANNAIGNAYKLEDQAQP